MTSSPIDDGSRLSSAAKAMRWYGIISMYTCLIVAVLRFVTVVVQLNGAKDSVFTSPILMVGLLAEMAVVAVPAVCSYFVYKIGRDHRTVNRRAWTTACIICMVPLLTMWCFWPGGVVIGVMGLLQRLEIPASTTPLSVQKMLVLAGVTILVVGVPLQVVAPKFFAREKEPQVTQSLQNLGALQTQLVDGTHLVWDIHPYEGGVTIESVPVGFTQTVNWTRGTSLTEERVGQFLKLGAALMGGLGGDSITMGPMEKAVVSDAPAYTSPMMDQKGVVVAFQSLFQCSGTDMMVTVVTVATTAPGISKVSALHQTTLGAMACLAASVTATPPQVAHFVPPSKKWQNKTEKAGLQAWQTRDELEVANLWSRRASKVRPMVENSCETIARSIIQDTIARQGGKLISIQPKSTGTTCSAWADATVAVEGTDVPYMTYFEARLCGAENYLFGSYTSYRPKPSTLQGSELWACDPVTVPIVTGSRG